jgi:DNA-binding beta-propeller fold protein YncE
MHTCRVLALCIWAVGCGDSPRSVPPRSCPDVCSPPRLTRLDLLAGQPGGPGWVDGALVAAHFADPWNIAGDGQGHLFVTDGETIRAVDVTTGTVTTLAGVFRQIGAADGVGAQATFNTPTGLVYTNGTLYVVDTENDTIRKIDVQSATVTTVAGMPGQVGAVDATGTDARFSAPDGLAIDASGNLYIGDAENHSIRKFDVQSGAVTTVAGTNQLPGNADGAGTAALFNKPKGLTIDDAGNLYVLDSHNRSIRKFDPLTAIVSTVASLGVLPLGLSIDSGNLIASLSDDRVVRVATDGTITTLAGGANAPGFVDGIGADARFDSPAGLFNDRAGTLYVADEFNGAIRAMTFADVTVRTFAGAKSTGDADGTSAIARFAAPQGLAADNDTVYVADTDNDTIRKVALASGKVTTLAGGAGHPDRADGALVDARFNHPHGLALDPAAQLLYVADTNNRSIRRIDIRAGTVSTLAYSVPPGDTFTGFDAPSGLALTSGHLFVTDYSDHAVVAIDLQKARASTFAGQFGVGGHSDGGGTSASFYGPLGICGDGHGNLYVADDLNGTVRKIEIASATVSTLAGQAGMQGDGDGIGADARFHDPIDLAADGRGDLFVSDLLNDTVRHVDVSNGTVTTVIGTTAASGVLLGPLPARLTKPSALALVPSGGLLVVSENAILVAH